MVILEEVLRWYGGIEGLRDRKIILEKDRRKLLLVYLGFGPTAEHAIRLVRINQFGDPEPEIHLEKRGDIWMPYYLRNRVTSRELFLYRFVGIREPLQPDLETGTRLIEMTGILDLTLWTEGFVEAAQEDVHPLLFVNGGAA